MPKMWIWEQIAYSFLVLDSLRIFGDISKTPFELKFADVSFIVYIYFLRWFKHDL